MYVPLCYLLIGLLVKYHQSGRPYKLIAACLEEVHGLRRRCDINTLYYGCLIMSISVRKIANSVAWLKKQFARLKLRRIGEYSPLSVVRNCVQVCETLKFVFLEVIGVHLQRELRGSNSLAGYRRMHAILRQTYALNVKR